MVQKVLDIAEEIGCDFLMENPATGLLKTRPVVEGIPMRVLDYCKYGMPYRKRTAIWTNSEWTPARDLCKLDCGHTEGRRHTARAQRGTSSGAIHGQTLSQLYSIPEELYREIAEWATHSQASAAK